MNDYDFEDRLARIINDNVDHQLATVPRRPPAFDPSRPRHGRPQRTRWLLPTAAAAAVAAITVGAVALVDNSHSHPHPTQPATTAPAPTSITTAPAPTRVTTPTTTPPTSAATVGTPVPAGFSATDVTFVDPRLGWVIGNGNCQAAAQSKCPYVLRTEDGGAHWVALPAPTSMSCGDNGGDPIYGACVEQISFANARIGYLWSYHSLFMTLDGGASWHNEHASAYDLAIADGHVLRWAPVADCSSDCAGVLQVASIGSSTWQISNPGGYTSSLFVSKLSSSPSTAYFASTRLSDGTAAIYRSTDGGATWTESGPQPCSARLYTLIAAPDNSVAVDCPTSSGPTTVSVSTDGGSSFTQHTVHTGVAQSAQILAASRLSLVAIILQQDNPNDPILVSHDGGSTWLQSATDPHYAIARGAGFTSTTDGYIDLGDGTAILTTSDAGRTWTTHPIR